MQCHVRHLFVSWLLWAVFQPAADVAFKRVSMVGAYRLELLDTSNVPTVFAKCIFMVLVAAIYNRRAALCRRKKQKCRHLRIDVQSMLVCPLHFHVERQVFFHHDTYVSLSSLRRRRSCCQAPSKTYLIHRETLKT